MRRKSEKLRVLRATKHMAWPELSKTLLLSGKRLTFGKLKPTVCACTPKRVSLLKHN